MKLYYFVVCEWEKFLYLSWLKSKKDWIEQLEVDDHWNFLEKQKATKDFFLKYFWRQSFH